MPTKATQGSAGFDLYVDLGEKPFIRIKPGESQRLSTGIALAIPEGYFGAIFARSGLATNQGLRPPNCVGVIDSDYRGEVGVGLCNDSGEVRVIENGQRVAQLVVIPCPDVEIEEVVELPETDRGAGGFGSTGTK